MNNEKAALSVGVAKQPDVYLAFESTPGEDKTIQYDRGHDGVGNAAASISNNAYIEKTSSRSGKVLTLRGVAPKVTIGANFGGTAIKYVTCLSFLFYD